LLEPEEPDFPEELPELELSSLPVNATGSAISNTMAIIIEAMTPRLVRGLFRILVKREGLLGTSAAAPPALRSASDNIWKWDILWEGLVERERDHDTVYADGPWSWFECRHG
jgi:hypothetical protein